MLHRDAVILGKIKDEAIIALDMIKNMSSEEFVSNEVIKRAVCMTVINIGELVKNLGDETRIIYNNIPWRAIAGFRDIAAHKYQTLYMSDVFKTVSEDFPELVTNIEAILKMI